MNDWKSALSKDKIIVFDMVGSGAIADRLKKQGYMVFGASSLADKLELDRAFGTKAMQTAGIPTPPTMVFTTFDEAIQYVETKGGRFVFKPDMRV